jgi:protein-disulfide isomerase
MVGGMRFDGAYRGGVGETARGLRLGFAALVMLTQWGCQRNPPVAPSRDDSASVVEGRAKDAKLPAQADATRADTDATVAQAPVKLPVGIDTKDLDDAEKRTLQEVFAEQYDPCGKSRSFLESLGDPATCDAAKKLGALAVDKIALGLSKKQVIQELLKETARWASKADFDVTGSPSYGEPGAGKKVVVEFFDYQCPHCKLASGPTKALVSKHGAVLYYKMLPLDQHPAARDAALVALAAERQGCFHALHDLLFAQQEALSPERNRALAKQAGCDLGRIESELKATGEGSVTGVLERDLKESSEAKVQGTPTFFVDGYEVEHDHLEDALKR